jgi:hypothetical protein
VTGDGSTEGTVALSAVFGMLAIICRSGSRGTERPSELIAWLWALLLAASAVVFPRPGISYAALLLIGTSIVGFAIGDLLGEAGAAGATSPVRRAAPVLAGRLRIATALASVAAAASCVAYLRGAGIALSAFATDPVHSMLATSEYYTYSRYGDPGFSEPSEAIFLGIGTYYGSATGGMLAAIAMRPKDWAMSTVPLLLGIVTMIILTTRATMMFSVALWAGGYIAGRMWVTQGQWRLLSRRRVVAGAFLVPAGLGAYLLIQALRRQSLDATTDSEVLDMAASAILGGPSALSSWLQKQELVVPGTRLFTGFARPLGFDRATIEPLAIGSLGAHANSNIVTMVGDAVVDVGEIGCPLVFALFGALAGAGSRMARRGRVLAVPVLTSALFIAFVSPIGSPLGYTVICAALTLTFATFVRFPPQAERR